MYLLLEDFLDDVRVRVWLRVNVGHHGDARLLDVDGVQHGAQLLRHDKKKKKKKLLLEGTTHYEPEPTNKNHLDCPCQSHGGKTMQLPGGRNLSTICSL